MTPREGLAPTGFLPACGASPRPCPTGPVSRNTVCIWFRLLGVGMLWIHAALLEALVMAMVRETDQRLWRVLDHYVTKAREAVGMSEVQPLVSTIVLRSGESPYSRMDSRTALRWRLDDRRGHPGHRRTVTLPMGRRRRTRLPNGSSG